MRNRSGGSPARAVDPSRPGLRTGLIALAAAALLLAAACSADPTPSNGVARLDSPSSTTTDGSASPAPSEDPYQQMLAYSQCMRQHGVPKFPDPVSNGNGGGGFQIQAGPGTGIDPNSATFQTAQEACQSLMPAPKTGTGGQVDQQQFQQMLAYSQCMRSHGLADFPDPQQGPGGGVAMQIEGGQGSDLDPNSPTFQAAQTACQSLVPGLQFGTSTSDGGTQSGVDGSAAPASPAGTSQP
jgi:hypothetical protein